MSVQKVTVHGAERLQATMTRAGHELAHMDAANARVATTVAQRARGAAPRRSGALARSTTGRAASGNRAEMTATVIYAGVIHNGWRRHHISPNPYLARTVERMEPQIVNLYGQEAQKIMDGVRGA